jgi:hypothetical protein
MTLTWELIMVVLLLVGVVWYKQRLDRRDSYRDGATQGFILGIDRTISTMVDQQLIARGSADPVLTKEDLMLRLAPVIADSIIKDAELLAKKDPKA